MNPRNTMEARVRCVALAVVATHASGHAQSVELISRTPAGPPSTGACYGSPVVSTDGRYIAFNSDASDFGPSNALGDVFVLDRTTHALELASPNSGGLGATVDARVGGVSDDGRYIAFFGDGLRPADLGLDYGRDILIRDRVLGTLTDLTGVDFEPPIYGVPKTSSDGNRIAYHVVNTWFGSYSTAILVKDRGGNLLGSRAGNATFGAGQPTDTWVESPFLSADGRYLVYKFRDVSGTQVRRYGFELSGQPEDTVASSATSAGSVDASGVSRDGRFVAYTRLTGTSYGTWLRDMQTGLEQRVDPTLGPALSTPSVVGGITDDGRFVAYASVASSLVTGDTNGVSDVFVRDGLSQLTVRISVDALAAQANGASTDCVIDSTGAAVVFLSAAANLVPGDVNGKADIFRRSMCELSFPDADGDGFGGEPALFSCAPTPPGHVAIGGDCDDADPTRHPGAQELCNGVDDDCDSLADEDIAGVAYCSGDGSGSACPCGNAGASGHGCASSIFAMGARLGTLGCASVSADTLVLAGSEMPDSSALYFQGTTQQNGGLGSVFGDGLRCAAGTLTRLGTKTNVAGTSHYPDVGDPPVSVRGLVTSPGLRMYQVWYRNAAAFCTPATFNLTNGWQVSWTL